MSKSKLWKFKKFLIISTMVLIAVVATPASAVYFSDSFKPIEKSRIQEATVIDSLFNIPNLISTSIEKLTGVGNVELASFTKAQILGKF